eukprot:1156347-Pelagomonas_calceolata.AAC.6
MPTSTCPPHMHPACTHLRQLRQRCGPVCHGGLHTLDGACHLFQRSFKVTGQGVCPLPGGCRNLTAPPAQHVKGTSHGTIIKFALDVGAASQNCQDSSKATVLLSSAPSACSKEPRMGPSSNLPWT